jgi:hypothetical protein
MRVVLVAVAMSFCYPFSGAINRCGPPHQPCKSRDSAAARAGSRNVRGDRLIVIDMPHIEEDLAQAALRMMEQKMRAEVTASGAEALEASHPEWPPPLRRIEQTGL